MKRLLFCLLILALAGVAYGDPLDRDVMLTSSGTLYTIESVIPPGFSDGTAARGLLLTIKHGSIATTSWAPTTLDGSSHFNASLAYDRPSDTLFVFWEKMPNALSSELLLASYHDGQWSDPLSIENSPFHLRWGLRIAVTRFAMDTAADGSLTRQAATCIHAVWWDQSSEGESARYAILSIDQQQVVSIQIRDLLEFAGSSPNPVPFPLPYDYDRDFFRHPAIFEEPDHTSVAVVFANWNTNRLERLHVSAATLQPQGVLHVPVGVWDGELDPPAKTRTRPSAATIASVGSVGGKNLIFYYRDGDMMSYISYMNGSWSDTQDVPLTDGISPETAVEALRRLAASE